MHSLHPAIARIWQTAKPCFVPGSLCECQSCLWEAFSCAPSLSQKLCIIVNGAYTGIQVPFQALQRLLCTCWHSEAELCIETALLTSCLSLSDCGNKTQCRRPLLSFFSGKPHICNIAFLHIPAIDSVLMCWGCFNNNPNQSSNSNMQSDSQVESISDCLVFCL